MKVEITKTHAGKPAKKDYPLDTITVVRGTVYEVEAITRLDEIPDEELYLVKSSDRSLKVYILSKYAKVV